MADGNEMSVLVAGGGVAAIEAALALRALAEDRVHVELVAPEHHFWYRPLAVAEPFKLGEARRFELAVLAARAGATFSPGELVSIDEARRVAHLAPDRSLSYSKLLIACGAVPKPVVEGALAFRGPADTQLLKDLLAEIESGDVHRVAFAVPAGAVWSLPAYELALMTASWLASRRIAGVELALATPEDEPLSIFGQAASDAVREMLAANRIRVHTRVFPAEARDGELILVGGDVIPADRVVALPRLQGPRIGGIPQTFEGFIPVDEHCRVTGLVDVYAAGDITAFAVKQGGIATQQADTAAMAIAAEAGVELTPRPFEPVLRGLLLTGSEPRYLRGENVAGADGQSEASLEPLWWPPAKIVGRYLTPFLAELAGTGMPDVATPDAGVQVEVELDPGLTSPSPQQRLEAALADLAEEDDIERVGDVMSEDPLVVAPEDTLGEVAEVMSRRNIGSALVADHGRLIGILTSRDLLSALAGRVHSSEARVRQWMTAEPITVSVDTPVAAAALLMAESNIHHLPVVDGERPVGMVGMRDLVRPGRVQNVGIGLGF